MVNATTVLGVRSLSVSISLLLVVPPRTHAKWHAPLHRQQLHDDGLLEDFTGADDLGICGIADIICPLNNEAARNQSCQGICASLGRLWHGVGRSSGWQEAACDALQPVMHSNPSR